MATTRQRIEAPLERLSANQDYGALGTECRGLERLTHFADVAELPRPPYEATLHQHTFMFAAPTAAVRAVLSPRLTPQRLFGKTPLVVIAARFTAGRSLTDGTAGAPYSEISYAVPVRRADGKDKRSYLAFLKLQLDSGEAIDVGRVRYGFPKYHAAVAYALAPERIAFRGTTEGRDVFDIVATRGAGRLQRLIDRGVHAWFRLARRVNGPVTAIFDRGDRLTTCVLRVDTVAAQRLHAERVFLPELVDKGLLRDGQRPLFAFALTDATMHIGAPVDG